MKLKKEVCFKVTFSALITIICLVCMVCRIRYGVDFSDEAWYVAEPYIVSQGATPYVDLWTQASGFTFPLCFVYDIFVSLNNSTEGIFLFSRIVYVIWVFVLGFVTCILVKKIPFIFYLPYIMAGVNALYDINYNTIGQFYSLFVLAVLFIREESIAKINFGIGLLAGICMARSIIGTPYTIIVFVLSLFFLIIKKRYSTLSGFVIGNALMAIITISYCSIKGNGIYSIFYGLKCFLIDGAYQNITPHYNFIDALSQQFIAYKNMWICLAVLGVIKILFLFVPVSAPKQSFQKSTAITILVFFLWGICQGFEHGNLYYLIYGTFFCGIFLYLFLGKQQQYEGVAIIILINVLWYYMASLGNIYGFYGRQYILMLSTVVSLWGVYLLCKDRRVQIRIGVYCMAIACCILVICSNYSNVYRDEEINKLDSKVEEGVWKGCYTTKEQKEGIDFFEREIKELTNPGEKVLFLDWASFGYLISDGQPFNSSTYDTMCYSYSVNNPQIMYDYFDLKKDIPDKIIYIDYGRDEKLSIEDKQWLFNEFINEFYDYRTSDSMNEYRIVIYEKKYDVYNYY